MNLVAFDGFPFVEGGVTAAKGFSAGGVHCGIRANKSKKDLGVILADAPCAAIWKTGPPGRSSSIPATPTPATPTDWKRRKECASSLRRRWTFPLPM